jgi:hypothetical protein
VTPSSTTTDLCRAVLLEVLDGDVVLGLPGTSYRIRLRLNGDPSRLADRIGKRITGRVEGKAMRMHPAHGGGRFIEPVFGHPRIVNGTIAALDVPGRRVLLDMVIPAWLTLADGQAADDFAVGQLVNLYVESGMSFTPSA